MRSLQLFVFISALLSQSAMGGDLQFNAGATSTTYDDSTDANSWGISVRAQYNFTPKESSWIVNYYGSALGYSAWELSSGYLWKTTGDFYVEGGLGASYSAIRGPGPLVIAGFGFKVGKDVYLDFPVTLTSTIAFVPYIGISF